MATATDALRAPLGRRAADALPWAGYAGWVAGCGVLWYLATRHGWTPGGVVLAGSGWLLVLAAVARDEVRNMFGPVFVYEVVRLGRRRTTFALRALYVGGVMALLAVMYLAWLDDVGYFRYGGLDRVPSERLSGFATQFFTTFIVVQFCVVGFLTPAYVAGAVADEKERKTLEFLLATDLRNREIVFGKLAARVTNLLMFVLAGLPVVAFLQLFGGIDPDLLLAAVAATVVTVVGLSAVGVYFSVHLRRPRDAIALTYLAACVYFVGSAFLAGYVMVLKMTLVRTGVWWELFGFRIDPADVLDPLETVTHGVASGNVLYQVWRMLVLGRGAISPAGVGDALFGYAVFWGLVSALALAVSVWRLRAVALRQSYGAPKVAKAGRRRSWRTRPPVGDDPMFWKEVFAERGVRGGCAGRLMAVAVVGLVMMFPVLIFVNTVPDPSLGASPRPLADRWGEFARGMNIWCRMATGILGTLTMLGAAVRGSAVVSGERDRDTWVSLVSTPLTAWEMLRGKWLGTVLGLRQSYAALLLVWATALAVGGVASYMVAATAVYLAVYVSAFAWVGIYCSITARTTLIATVRAIMAAVFLAGGFWLFLMLCCGMPLEIVLRGVAGRTVEDLAQVLLGSTPAFVVGWMPLLEFRRQDMGPFSWQEGDGIGPLSPVFGLAVWVGVNGIVGTMAWRAFLKATNRAKDRLSDRLPRPLTPTRPAPRRSSDTTE